MDTRTRCGWCGTDPLYVAYHDDEWGVPVHDDRGHFEHLCLEAAQAGLSWITVLRKRPRYREVFHGFDPEAVARMGPSDVERLLGDPGIIRNRKKIEAVIANAPVFLRMAERHGSFSAWLWDFVDGTPVRAPRASLSDVPATTPLSDRVSRALKKEGFRFVGSTTTYAHLQATGLVDDHLDTCWRHTG
ncbi:MAG: DNA-3-methyladenine glycosylase I [Alphaproteobacteria bacterium]|nr:DNA-3-methyladenine glycosylase I [Alphaproteobacteria bacterium]